MEPQIMGCGLTPDEFERFLVSFDALDYEALGRKEGLTTPGEKVLDEIPLRVIEIERGRDLDVLGPHLLRRLGQLDKFTRAGGHGPHRHRHPPVGGFDHGLGGLHPLLERHRLKVAGGTAREKHAGPGPNATINQKLNMPLHRRQVQFQVRVAEHGRDRGVATAEILPILFVIHRGIVSSWEYMDNVLRMRGDEEFRVQGSGGRPIAGNNLRVSNGRGIQTEEREVNGERLARGMGYQSRAVEYLLS